MKRVLTIILLVSFVLCGCSAGIDPVSLRGNTGDGVGSDDGESDALEDNQGDANILSILGGRVLLATGGAMANGAVTVYDVETWEALGQGETDDDGYYTIPFEDESADTSISGKLTAGEMQGESVMVVLIAEGSNDVEYTAFYSDLSTLFANGDADINSDTTERFAVYTGCDPDVDVKIQGLPVCVGDSYHKCEYDLSSDVFKTLSSKSNAAIAGTTGLYIGFVSKLMFANMQMGLPPKMALKQVAPDSNVLGKLSGVEQMVGVKEPLGVAGLASVVGDMQASFYDSETGGVAPHIFDSFKGFCMNDSMRTVVDGRGTANGNDLYEETIEGMAGLISCISDPDRFDQILDYDNNGVFDGEDLLDEYMTCVDGGGVPSECCPHELLSIEDLCEIFGPCVSL